MDTSRSILQSARQFFAGTALSRLSGFIRDVSMAFCFGSSPEIAAFMVAYRFANLFRRLFGEGNIQAGFIPHFEALRRQSELSAFSFYRDTAFSLMVLLVAFILGFEGILFFVQRRLTGGWSEIAYLTMLMAPGLLFICLSALNSALLQCQKKYFSPAMAPVLFNAVWIAVAFGAYRGVLRDAVRFLSVGISVAFMAQWLVTAAQVRKEWTGCLDWEKWFRPRLFSDDWKKILKPMALGIIGVGAMQINSALDALFARIADPSGPAYLWYAIRVQQLPLALFGIALSGALLPPLSRAIQEGQFERAQNLMILSLRRAGSLMMPCMFGLLSVGAAGLNLLYGRGSFSSSDLQETLLCLWAYGASLVPSSFILLLAAGSFAKKDYALPTRASLISIALHVLLNSVLIFTCHLGAISIALATSASAWLNCVILIRKHKVIIGVYLAKTATASALAAIVAIGLGQLSGDGTLQIYLGADVLFAKSLLLQVVQFGVAAGAYLITFLTVARTLQLNEVFELLQRP